MPSRMDKYNSEEQVKKRVVKNQTLYEGVKDYRVTDLTEPVEIEPIIKIKDITNIVNDDNDDEKENKIVKEEHLKIDSVGELLILKDKDKEYDINKVLKREKENRVVKDDLEEKRKLKKDEYNITSSIDLSKIDEISKNKNKKEVITEEESKEISNIIDTIYSKKLREEIEASEDNRDLMSDLIAENDETIIDEEMAKNIIEEEKSATEEIKNIDNSFYTKSMELSKEDLEIADDSFVDKENKHIGLKIIILLIILIIIGFICYFIYKNI